MKDLSEFRFGKMLAIERLSRRAGRERLAEKIRARYVRASAAAGERSESIHSRLLAVLEKGPASPDELIAALWGASAEEDFTRARNRLYSAVRAARKNGSASIAFDGSRYRLE